MTMPNEVKNTPFGGYQGGHAGSLPSEAFRKGHPMVVALYREYTGAATQVANWEFRKRIIGLAVKMFGNRGNWFIEADNEPTIQDYNYEFILDTVRFIATGQRRISIHAWPDLIGHNQPDAIPREHTEVRKLFRDLALATDTASLIQQWCSKPRGIDDLMLTMNILFGNRVTQVTE